jgi:hypothetical protein
MVVVCPIQMFVEPVILDTRIAGNDIWLSQRRTDYSRNLRT